MKKVQQTLLVVVLSLLGTTAFAQNSGFGFKGGVNFGANGDYKESVNAAIKYPDRNIGYHVGIFGKIGGRLYVRPEVMYTKTKSDYADESFNLSKIDAPVLVGLKILGPVSIFAGPDFQYILESEFEGITIDDIEDNFSVGLHVGVGVNLGKIGFDLRYERGFSANEAKFINSNLTSLPDSRLDTRPEQIVLSMAIKL